MPARASLPPAFIKKKQKILATLDQSQSDYNDKSPKGSVDVQCRDLIDLINAQDGWVTTSSCAGRVAVFVEGARPTLGNGISGTDYDDHNAHEDDEDGMPGSTPVKEDNDTPRVVSSASGKGGGHWLFTSHDPVPLPRVEESTLKMMGLLPAQAPRTVSQPVEKKPQLIHLSFSPLILHILCATLNHARPLLTAAINAGFRESGVQSLKMLDENYVGDGVMLAIRTSGLVFETIVGVVESGADGDVMRAAVSEEYVRMCMDVINERFRWNTLRKGRLVREIEKAITATDADESWESTEDRRERKRKEGLERQAATAHANADPDMVNPEKMQDTIDLSTLGLD